MNNSWLIYLVSYFLATNGKLKKNNQYYSTTTVYEYFFAETFTVADFNDFGWHSSGNIIKVSSCGGKSIVG